MSFAILCRKTPPLLTFDVCLKAVTQDCQRQSEIWNGLYSFNKPNPSTNQPIFLIDIYNKEKKEEGGEGHSRNVFDKKEYTVSPYYIPRHEQEGCNDNQSLPDLYMALERVPVASDAVALVGSLTVLVAAVMGVRPLKKLNDAVGAITGDLLACYATGVERYSYRPIGRDTFTGLAVGYRPTLTALQGFSRLDWLDMQLGYYKADGTGESSKFRLRDSFLIQCDQYGVKPQDHQSHFALRPRAGKVPKPIMLRAQRKKGSKAKHGKALPVDHKHAKVIAARQQVERINAFFVNVPIEGCEHRGFRRMFGAGNHPDFDWDMGGRLYAIGGGYQELSQEERRSIRLDGEATIELDIKGSHPTILRKLLGYEQKADPYDIAGLDRDVVKRWVTMTLGNGQFLEGWSQSAIGWFASKRQIDLEEEFPYKALSERIKAHLPEIGEALEQGLIWGRLQYIESCAAIDAVEELAVKHGIPALPVHDSLIVPASKEGIARSVLKAAFLRNVGVEPVLELK